MPGYFNDIEGTRVLSKTTARIIDNVEIRTLKNHMNKMIYLYLFFGHSVDEYGKRRRRNNGYLYAPCTGKIFINQWYKILHNNII